MRHTPITTGIAAAFLVCVGVFTMLMSFAGPHVSSTPSLFVGAALIGGGVIGFWLNRL